MTNLEDIANSPAGTTTLDTLACFDKQHQEQERSPIDRFFTNHRKLPQLHNASNQDDPVLNGLLLLGSVSAVEGYMREIVRRLVVLDPLSKKACERRMVSYGAAVTLSKDLLPEALLEDVGSLASPSGPRTVICDLLGIGGAIKGPLKAALEPFGRVCQMRHCMVHRFGKLGARNAIELDLDTHGEFVEKPLRLSFDQIQHVLATNEGLVRELNRYLCCAILTRCAKEYKWKDRANFKRYFKIFHSNDTSNTGILSESDAFDVFKGIGS